MDEDTKNQFKWKFYRLTMQLNIIILVVALSVLAFFLVPDPFRIPLIIGMLILALVLSLDCLKKYKVTKAWLDEHGGKGKNT